MNKYQQALDDIRYPVTGNQIDYQQPYVDEAYSILQELVDKTIPMEPRPHALKILKEEFYDAKMFDCPECGGVLIPFEHQKYCHKCGQALNWSEDD